MRFMFIVKSAHSGPPPPKLMEAMHKLADREIKAGRMLDNGGLMPVAMGAQVRIAKGAAQRPRRPVRRGQGACIAPYEPEAHGLLALMELNASRTAARTDAVGEPILLLDQNRALWDQLQIRRGMQALGRAHELGGASGSMPSRRPLSPATPRLARRATPTGRASPDSMRSWRRSCARPSSNSTARLPSAWPRAQKRGCRSWTALCARLRSKAITCCRAFAATYSISSAVTKRRAPRSKRPRRWPATSANMIC